MQRMSRRRESKWWRKPASKTTLAWLTGRPKERVASQLAASAEEIRKLPAVAGAGETNGRGLTRLAVEATKPVMRHPGLST
jgi:hypothetical protein